MHIQEQDFRLQALKHYEALGLPKTVEPFWRYTPSAMMDLSAYHEASSADYVQERHTTLDVDMIYCNGTEVRCVDMDLPAGVEVLPLLEALAQFPERVLPYLQQLEHEHGFQALNSAAFKTGVWIYVPESVKLSRPIMICHQARAHQLTHVRHVLVAEANSHISLVECFEDLEGGNSFSNHMTQIFLKTKAVCEHIKIQALAASSILQSELCVHQAQASDFNSFVLQQGARISHFDAQIFLDGEYANLNLNGVFIAKGQSCLQQRINVLHNKPNATSQQNFRGIIDDQAKGVFMGQVWVAKDAFATTAHQSNKNLLLSKKAEVYTLPQLQIYTDEVVCTHGATVGQLDADALFYLQTRGLAQAYARSLLLQSFWAEPLASMRDARLKAWCSSQMEGR